jgi:K+-sensing histidine kinase KdpD
MTGATGLALDISKMVFEQPDGIIGFDKVPGQGANFYFELPLANTPPVSDPTPAPSTAPLHTVLGKNNA